MRNPKWKIPFKTLNESEAEVTIYEEGYEGDVTELTPSETPFETSDENSDDLMVAVRTQSGYIRVMDSGDVNIDIVPSSASQHYVEFKLNGQVKFAGYMQPDTYTADWEAPPVEVELPVVSGIAYLSGVYMDQTKDMDMMRMGDLLKEIVEATGIEYEHIIIPNEVAKSEDEAGTAPLLMEISRALFFDRNTDYQQDEDYQPYAAKTYMEALISFATFWGWTVMERGLEIYFVSTDAGSYLRYDMDDFGSDADFANYEEVNAQAMELNSLHMDGDGHTQEVRQGYRKIIVKAKTGKVDTAFEYPSTDNLPYYGSMTRTTAIASSRNRYKYDKLELYKGKSETENLELFQYTTGLRAVEDYDPEKVFELPGAVFAEYDTYTSDEVNASGTDKKVNFDYTSGIIVNINNTNGDQTKCPILRIKREGYRYKKGYIVISAKTRGVKNADGGTSEEENNAGGTISAKLRIGDFWWTGNAWSESETTFDIQMGSGTSTDVVKDTAGEILSTKKLTDKCNGAEGYVISTDGRKRSHGGTSKDIKGDMELTLYFPSTENYNRVYMDGFKVEYMGNDDYIRKDSDESENRYTAVLNTGFSEEKEVELDFATDNDNQEGYGIIGYEDENVSKLYYRGILQTIRPELALVDRMKRMYGRITQALTLEVVYGDVTPITRVVYDGRTFAVTGENVDWKNESEELIITEN